MIFAAIFAAAARFGGFEWRCFLASLSPSCTIAIAFLFLRSHFSDCRVRNESRSSEWLSMIRSPTFFNGIVLARSVVFLAMTRFFPYGPLNLTAAL